MSKAHWDQRFMELAIHVAGWSKDRSTKVGCVIVGPANEVRSVGCNGFPRGANDDMSERHERPAKYLWTEHAERNAIYNAARCGISLVGCQIYLPWFPCMDCARAIVQSGIMEIVAIEPSTDDEETLSRHRGKDWSDHFRAAKQLFGESGVRIRWYQELGT